MKASKFMLDEPFNINLLGSKSSLHKKQQNIKIKPLYNISMQNKGFFSILNTIKNAFNVVGHVANKKNVTLVHPNVT